MLTRFFFPVLWLGVPWLSGAEPFTDSSLSKQLSSRDTTSVCKLVAHPPAGSGCGQKGTCDGCSPFAQQFVGLSTCARFCSDLNLPKDVNARAGAFALNCAALTHDSKTNLCQFFRSPPADKFTNASASTTSLYSFNDCFACRHEDCGASTSLNFFNNPNFDISNSEIGPWFASQGYNPDYTLIPNPVGQGNAIVFQPSTQGQADTFFEVVQDRHLCRNQTYLLSFDYKVDQLTTTPPGAEKDAATVTVGSAIGDCFPGTAYVLDDSRLGQWQTALCSALGENNYLVFFGEFSFGTEGAGATGRELDTTTRWNVTYANIRLSRLPQSSIKPKGPSLVQNGGFESGQLAPWDALVGLPDEYQYLIPEGNCATNSSLGCSIVRPGLPASKNARVAASKFKFKFTGFVNEFGYGDGQRLDLSQSIKTENVAYILEFEYYTINMTLAGIFFGDIFFQTDSRVVPQQKNATTTIFQRVVSGANGTTDLTIRFSGPFGSRGVRTRSYSVFVDNVSLRLLDM